ncbi:hypothetical protein APA386B_1P141 (plasmid) [Acetobacter pasteurianus 386B]|nr:hypothetical protein APA386B_1P141 [Acetobacter pasteurianus 386B]
MPALPASFAASGAPRGLITGAPAHSAVDAARQQRLHPTRTAQRSAWLAALTWASCLNKASSCPFGLMTEEKRVLHALFSGLFL